MASSFLNHLTEGATAYNFSHTSDVAKGGAAVNVARPGHRKLAASRLVRARALARSQVRYIDAICTEDNWTNIIQFQQTCKKLQCSLCLIFTIFGRICERFLLDRHSPATK